MPIGLDQIKSIQIIVDRFGPLERKMLKLGTKYEPKETHRRSIPSGL